MQEKLSRLQEVLRASGSIAIAFSGGVDSTFLPKIAHDLLGDKCIALTAQSCFFPAREMYEAEAFCRHEGIRQILLRTEPLAVPGIRENPKNRCYLCKRALFTQFLEIANENGISAVAEGSNPDDLGDYRPGLQAVAELGILSPLRTADLHKSEIRLLSRKLGLPTWEKPSFACLASRFPYGETITEEQLQRIDRAEQFLLDQGFRQLRVRIHGKAARIELLPEDFPRLLAIREEVTAYFRDCGFAYTSLDLQGYRMGSMNETLPADSGTTCGHS